MKQEPKEYQKAERVFSSAEDVTRYFEENPHRLVAYVEMGASRKVSIPGIYIAMLANKVGLPLRSGTQAFKTLPMTFLTKPTNFNNIQAVLDIARKAFPPPSYRRHRTSDATAT